MNHIKKTFVCIFILIANSWSMLAQENLDIVTLSGRYGFPSSYDSIYKSKAKEYGSMLAIVAPIEMSKKTIWYNSLNYFYWHVSNEDNPPDNIADPIDLHGIILRTGVYQKLSDDRGIQIILAPRFMSDFQNVNSSHFQFGGIFLYEKKYSEVLKVGFGAMYNQEFFGPYLVPLIQLNWKISENWSIDGLLPVYTKIKYNINDRFNVGFSHFGLTTSYRLGDPNYYEDYMERKSIDETLFARYNIGGNIFIEGRFGYSLGRSYTQYEADQKVAFSLPLISFGDDRVQKNISFHDGLIASLRLVYSINLNNRHKL